MKFGACFWQGAQATKNHKTINTRRSRDKYLSLISYLLSLFSKKNHWPIALNSADRKAESLWASYAQLSAQL
jgi:hypothetical protein